MPEVGMEGQKQLKAASVLLIGAGGLGSPLALYLAAAGVGRIGLVDFDVVDDSNLQRQVIHGTARRRPAASSSRREARHRWTSTRTSQVDDLRGAADLGERAGDLRAATT